MRIISRNNLFILFGILTIGVAFLQSRPEFSLFGFRPNIFIALLLALALLYENFFMYFILTVLSFLTSFHSEILTLPALTAFFLVCFAFFGVRMLPWLWPINLAFTSGVITAAVFIAARPLFAPGEFLLLLVDAAATFVTAFGAYVLFETIIARLRGSLSHI